MKRCFDLFWTIGGLTVLWPLFGLIAGLIKLEDHGPVFYWQERVGRHAKPFRIWKFRTMVQNADQLGPPLTVGFDLRVTRVGYWLRKLKLDELPQLFNVLSGKMSLVGPRPEVARYTDQYTQQQRKVLDLTPGITDVASIEFRRESELLAKAADPEHVYREQIVPIKIWLNLSYAARANVLTDFVVVLRTLGCLLNRSPPTSEAGARESDGAVTEDSSVTDQAA